MTAYDYQARTSSGELAQGVIVADSPSEATKNLRAEGKYVVNLAESTAKQEESAPTEVNLFGRRVKSDDVIFFASQMSVMVDTGVPITEAMEGIIQQTTSPAFKDILSEVLRDVEAGTPLSDALAKHRKVFKPLFVNLVRASEISGQLGPMLERCVRYMVSLRETRKKVLGAMAYPAFLMFMSVAVVIFLLVYLMPKFIGIYAGREHLLPTPTKVLIAVSTGLSTTWMWWAPISVGLIGGAFFYLGTTRGARVLHWLLLNVPIVGRMFSKTYLVRSLRTLGTLIRSGVSMLDAVSLTREVAGNRFFQDMWDAVDARVQQGEQLSQPLLDSSLMPRPVVQMISSGERSGQLAEVLDRISEFLEADLERSIKRVTQMIEPIMILIMGTIVGSIVIALLLPIFTISRVVAQ